LLVDQVVVAVVDLQAHLDQLVEQEFVDKDLLEEQDLPEVLL
jgi:hypothetical protein